MSSKVDFWQKSKWQSKYLGIAQTIADDVTDCYSRKVGCVIVSDDNTIVSLGYNGPFRGCPAPDEYDYLRSLFIRLSDEDQHMLFNASKTLSYCHFKYDSPEDIGNMNIREMTAKRLRGCQQCPRKLLDIPSGERRDICPCACAERNALNNANRFGGKTLGAVCFCTLSPCSECAISLIQAGIRAVIYLGNDDSHPNSASMSFFDLAGVEVIISEANSV